MASKTVLSIILKAIDAASGTFSKVDKKLTKLSKKATAIGKKMTAGLTLPLVAMAGASAKAAATFEKGMSDVSTLIDTNVESLDEMSAKVLEMSTAADQAAVPLEDMTSALFDIRSAGIDAGDAMDVLSQAAKLGVAGLGTTKQAADLGTSAINAFGLKGKEAAQVFNTFFATTRAGKTTIAELSQGFGGVAGIVAANNVSLEEFMAITAVLTKSGLKASETFTQQKAILSGLTRVTDESSKVFKKLGVKDLPGAIDKFGGLQGAVVAVSGAVDGNKGKLLKLLGSTEALNAALVLTSKQGEDVAKVIGSMGATSKELEVAFEKQNKTASAGFQRMKNSVNAAAISLGKVLGPVASKVAAIIGKISNAFAALDDDTKEVIVTIAALVAVIGPLLIVGSKMVVAFIAVKGAVAAVSGVITTLAVTGTGATGVMAGLTVAVGGLLAKIALFAGAAALVLGVGVAAFKVGTAFDRWFQISEKLADVIGQIVDAAREFANLAGALDPRRLVSGVEIKPPPEVQAAIDAQRAGGDPQAAFRATQIDQARSLASDILGPARAAELVQGIPGEGGRGGTVKVEFNNVPRGTRVTQTEGDPIDLQVGRQLAMP